MRRLIIPVLFFCTILQSAGQSNLEFNTVLGGNSSDEAKDIKANSSQTTLFLGARTFSDDGDVPSNAGGADFLIMKMDINGTLDWSKTFGGSLNDDLEVVLPHSDGGVLGFGTTRTSQGLFGTIIGQSGAWLMRTNSNGSIIDGEIFGGINSELARDAFRHISGDVTMTMEASSPVLNGDNNHGLSDVWIVHVNSALNTQWSLLLGGAGVDAPKAITADINGNIYLAASSNSNLPDLPMNQGESDLWILKISPSGSVLWQKSFGGSKDDIANDIVFHPDGTVYVLAQSNSSDGDFEANYGINDLWVLKLDGATGEKLDAYQYGGTGNEYDGSMTLYGADQLAISTNTTSSNEDLTGNKGFGDVWMFTIDLDGNIQSQMNYGGSLNDLAGNILTVDSIFHLFSSTLSTDKNVPVNSLAQLDLWYYTLNPNPDTCSTQFLCQPDSMLTNHLYPPANDALICVSGCTAGYGPGPIFNTGSCPDFNNPTAYFFVTTDTTADLLTISVNSSEFNKPQIALLRSVNCQTFVQVECAIGENGFALLNYVDIQPLTTYVVAITDAEGNIGDFEFCVTSVDVEFCNEDDRIYVTQTSMNSPLSGPFKPGEEVQICYELTDWNKLDCNGFQGLMPTFGPGWDPSSFNSIGEPVQTDTMLVPETNGFWKWYKLGDVRYNVSNPINGYDGGQGMPPGWYYTNTADPPPADNPDQTTGDINTCLPTSDKWKVCFTLTVVDECESNLDCSVTMKTFSDGELGINTSLACAYDQEEKLIANLACCINPSIQAIQDFSICSGDTIVFKPETNLFPPVTYSWTADADPFISGHSGANNVPQFYQILTNNSAVPLKVRYSIRAKSDDCQTGVENFEITVLPLPTSRLTLTGPNIVCSGSTVTFNFESTGTPPFSIGLYKDNQPFADILSETPLISIAIDPVFSGTFRIGSVHDANCEGFGTGFANVTVKPVGTASIDTALCEGETITVGGETFSEAGTYTVTIDNGAENNCDSIIVLGLSITPSMTETIDEVICNGDTLFVLGEPYTETTDEVITYIGPLGCPNYINLHLFVEDTFSMTFEQTICFGDTVVFKGIEVYEPGSYSHVEEIRPGCFEETILELSVLPAILINDLAIIGDNGANTGAILVEIIGGNPPLSYQWNSGQTTESIFNVMHGMYQLVVTDQLGCEQIFDFEVPMINSTADLGQGDGKIIIRPNLLSSTGEIKIINSSDEKLEVTKIEWISVSGESIAENINFSLDVGGERTITIPTTIPPGIHILRLSLREGGVIWRKVFVVE